MPIDVKKYIDVDSQDTPIVIYRDKMPVLDTLNVTPDTVAQEIVPEDGVDGFNKVNVSAVNATIDSNIVPGNIKAGVNILGVNGAINTEIFGTDPSYLLGYVDSEGGYRTHSGTVQLDFSGIERIYSSMRHLFYNNDKIGGNIVFNDLLAVYNSMYQCFYGCYYIESFSAPKLVTLNQFGFQSMLSWSKIKSFSMDAIITLSDYACNNICSNCGELETVSMEKLETVNVGGLSSAFTTCPKLETVSLPALKYVRAGGLQSAFVNSQLIETMTYPSLESVYEDGFSQTYLGCVGLKTLYFPALKDMFGDSDRVFNNMLNGCSNVTVHFPSNLQSVIGQWADVLNGFGGTNTTVLFDLPATE